MNPLLDPRCALFAVLACSLPASALAQSETQLPEAAPEAEPSAPAQPEEPMPPAEASATAEPPLSEPIANEPAASESESSTQARKMDLSTPPPPPPRHRKARVHNGFYLRGSFGAGGLWAKVLDRSDAVTRAADADGGAFALSFEGLVGASPADGFALGGGASWTGGSSELGSDDDEVVDTTLGLLLVGPFFDAFPEPKDGFHLGAMVGYAMHSIQDHPSGVDSTHGFGGSAWLGYDWWVSDELSAGLMARFLGGITSGSDGPGELRMNSAGFTVVGTAVWH